MRWTRGSIAAVALAGATLLATASCDALFNIGEPDIVGGPDGAADRTTPQSDASRRDSTAEGGSGSGSTTASGTGSGTGTGPSSGSGTGTGTGTDGGGDSGATCLPGTQRCAGDGIETCEAAGLGGHWSAAWACATGTCTGAGCTGSTTSGTSCTNTGAGLNNCGSSMESCCTSLEIVGGTYNRTYTNTGTGPTATADPATVSGFRLDKYLVTVGRFRQFVNAWNGGAGYFPLAATGKHAHLNSGQGLVESGSPGTYEPGWDTTNNPDIAPSFSNLNCVSQYATWTMAAGSQERLPITCVNWWEAYAFCIWDGGFLPSESEWEYAAAGGSEELEYPWGSAVPGMGNMFAIYGCEYPSATGMCTTVGNIAPVGTAVMGAGVWGQLDLAGEVWEWTLDLNSTYVSPCVDCSDQTTGTMRTLRGGLFSSGVNHLVPPFRNSNSAGNRNGGYGFRCARTP